MAGRRPWPPDPTRQDAFDYDEDTARIARRHKHGYHFRSKADRRKPYSIESRIIPTEESIIRTLGLDQWFAHGRYTTEARRDQAFEVLVAKSERELRGWSKTEWRKVG